MQSTAILILALVAFSYGLHANRFHRGPKKANSLPKYDEPMPEGAPQYDEVMYHDGLSCKDKYSNCPTDLKQYCESHSFVKTDWCQKSCGYCSPDPAPAYVTAQPKISSAEMENIKAICLAAHNAKRALHQNTPSMTYDMELAKRAQTYAEYLLEFDQWKHDEFRTYNGYESGVGENLYWSSSTARTSSNAVDSWYNEINNYNFGTGGSNGGVIGHFTQLVWDTSTKLGCGVAKSLSGGTYVVSRYLVAGNTSGKYTQHVHTLKPAKDQQDPPVDIEKVL